MPANTNFPPLTVENYKLLPETGPRYQLIQGDLYMAPLLPGWSLLGSALYER